MTTTIELPLQTSVESASPVDLFFRFMPDARNVRYTDRRGAHYMPTATKAPDRDSVELLVCHYVSDMIRTFAKANQADTTADERQQIVDKLATYSEFMNDQAHNADRFRDKYTMGGYILEAAQRIALPNRMFE